MTLWTCLPSVAEFTVPFMAGSTATRTRAPAVVSLKRNADGELVLFADLRELGFTSYEAMASHLNCGIGTVFRFANDTQNPGLDIIAKVAEAFPDQPLSRYFDSPFFSFAPKAA
jgi:hypothetical protein